MKKAVKLVSLFLILTMAMFVFVACGPKSSEESSTGSSTESQPETKAEDIIKISAIGLQDPVKMVEQFTPFSQYLSKEIGKKVEFVPCADYAKVVEGLKNGTIDMAHLGPVTYVQAHDGFGGEALVKGIEKGKFEYSSVIFVRGDSPIKSVKELKGKKVAFGDKDSMSSNCGPKYFMFNNGVKVEDLAEAKNFTSQDEVVSQVVNKDYDAGTVKDSIFEKNKDKNLKEIGRQTNIPTFSMTVRPGLDAKVKEDLKKAMLKLTDTEILKGVDGKYTGFTEGKDSDYAWVREAMNKLGIK